MTHRVEQIGPCELHLGDCLEILPTLTGVDAVVTSPPYGIGKSYETANYGEWLALMHRLFASLSTLDEDGFAAIVIGDIRCHHDPFLPRVRIAQSGGSPTTQEIIDAIREGRANDKDSLRSIFRVSDQTVDRRLKGNNARGSKREPQSRVRLSAADVTRAAEASGFYLYDSRAWIKDPCWQTCQYHSSSYRAVDEFEHILIYAAAGANHVVDRGRLEPGEWGEWGSRGAWHIPSVHSNDDHPAKFPELLASRLARLLADSGKAVCDPFMGSGTTGVACIKTGRKFIGIEIDETYFDIACKRIRKAWQEKRSELPLETAT